MRRPIIAGNWKMYKTRSESVELASLLKPLVQANGNVEVVICPPYINLDAVNEVTQNTDIKLGAQNLYWEQEGAYTGEVSAEMLKSVGCEYVIIGHSERRIYFGETNESVNKKIKKALEVGLLPIVCVGEQLEEREAGDTNKVVEDHVTNGLRGLSKDDMSKIVIAYEPVWAIGTGKTATPEQAEEVHLYIRNLLSTLFDKAVSESVRIQYGGSVKPANITELMKQPDIDGALVGGASLEVTSFANIVMFGE